MPNDVEKQYRKLIYYRTYSRWDAEKGRRENWDETVRRYYLYMLPRVPDSLKEVFGLSIKAVARADVMPSMRLLWAAGPAAERDNLSAYNCSYLALDSIRAFGEMLYLLMNGTGVGYSVEQRYIEKLPRVPEQHEHKPGVRVVFADSKRGWAEGFYQYLRHLWNGVEPGYDLSRIRPAGSILKTFGGRASGPEPLEQLLQFTHRMFINAQGRRLNSLEVHDLACWIANIVVVGGVRRSACISLSDLGDDRMAKAKVGNFYSTDPQRRMANISVAYSEKPSARKFISEWLKLMESRSGERGLFNREAARHSAISTGRRSANYNFGTNPCGEVSLRPKQLCNLTEVIVRPTDSLDELKDKVKYATLLGTLQSTLTKFRFVGREWKKNCEEERLLGVSLTGLMDHPVLSNVSKEAKRWLSTLKEEALETAEEWSTSLGIPMPKAVTCVKPSGTVSQLVGCSSGLHPRYSPYYIRRVRINTTDPVAKLLLQSGYNGVPEIGDDPTNPKTLVFEFPIKSPEESRMGDEISALEQLEYWLMLKRYWCEHNPSVTIYVRESEWMEVGAWVWKNWDFIGGLTFLPRDDNVYQLAPYEEIDEETYHRMVRNSDPIDWSLLSELEQEDHTEGKNEFACSGGACEL